MLALIEHNQMHRTLHRFRLTAVRFFALQNLSVRVLHTACLVHHFSLSPAIRNALVVWSLSQGVGSELCMQFKKWGSSMDMKESKLPLLDFQLVPQSFWL